MRTIELYRALGKLVKEGHGDRVVQLMQVKDGLTYALDIDLAFAAQSYDGNRVWLQSGKIHPPEWSNSATPTLS